MNQFVEIVDVGPRDGLQSQSKIVSTDTKLSLIERLIACGTSRIEVASFVNPKRVPQMADVDELVARLPSAPGVRYIGLVLNEQGCERGLAAGLAELNCATVTTETFCQRNQGATPAQMLAVITRMARLTKAAGVRFGVTIAAAFGCPFEGLVASEVVVEMVREFIDVGIDEIALADTIGVAVPAEVEALVDRVMPICGSIPLRMHFHDTRNTGVANVQAAVKAGVRVIDASCGGVGGCPFAPNATGNVATEDVLYLLHRSGFDTGIDLARLVETAKWLETALDSPLPARVSRASLFPPVAGQAFPSYSRSRPA